MPIIHSLKPILIHIPIAGGTSIECCLFDFPLFRYNLVSKFNWYGNIKTNELKYELDHSTIAYLKNNCKYFDNNYFKFAFVRHPYRRLVSEYHYCKYQYSRFIKNLDTFKDFVYELREKFEEVINGKENNHLYVSHYLPQYLFTNNYRKIQLVDKVYKVENIEEDLKDLCKNLNIDRELIKTEKNSSKFEYNFEDYYDEEIKEIVYELYKDDFIIFGYEK